MKVLLTFLLLVLNSLWLIANDNESGKGSGFGYILDLGGSAFSQPTYEYDQFIGSITHNGFVRFHKSNGRRALQLMVGYKTDIVMFQNYSDFLGPDDVTMMDYDTDAQINRNAWKFAMIQQYQFGRNPGKLLLSINPGLFFEHTVHASRMGTYDGFEYQLYDEIRPNNLGYTCGIELRIKWLTIGYKFEGLFWDPLDHDYILSQELNTSNSSELRGLVMNPTMNYFYLGINIDFYDD